MPRAHQPTRTARLRATLLHIAQRRSGIEFTLTRDDAVVERSADVLTLLDELNGAGILAWGGLHRRSGDTIIRYDPKSVLPVAPGMKIAPPLRSTGAMSDRPVGGPPAVRWTKGR